MRLGEAGPCRAVGHRYAGGVYQLHPQVGRTGAGKRRRGSAREGARLATGAYIPTAGNPQRTAMGMPLAHYPDVPSIRYQPIQGGVNMESRAAALQQSPLPGGFAGEGLARARKPFLRLFCARGRIVWNLPAIDASPILASSHKPLQTLAKFAPAKKCRPLRPIKEAG